MSIPVTDAITHVQDSLEEFKDRHLKKLDSIDGKVSETDQRLQKLEKIVRRPAMAFSDLQKDIDADLDLFIRKGIEDGLTTKALHSSQDTGSFMLPPATVELIQRRLTNLSPLRHIAHVTTISSDALELLVDKTEPDVGWVAETADRGETESPELAKIRIPVHEIYAKPRVSQKLLDDSSIAIESWLADKVADKMARFESLAFFHGDGKGKPRGVLTHEITPLGQPKWGAIETSFLEKQKVLEEPEVLIDTYYALKSEYLPGASWVMPRVIAAQIRKMRDKATGSYLWQDSLAKDTPDTLLGHPVYLCDDLIQEDGKAPAILFGNFNAGYQIVDRAQMHILRDPYSSKPYVEFYTTKRVGGDVINFEALKLIKMGEA